MLKKFQEKFSGEGKEIIIYTGLWLICVAILMRIFHKDTFLWGWDGVYAHFASFYYLCDYLRDIIYNHQLDGFYNFTLGQGMDILTTLNGYDFTDPVSIFSALIFPLPRITRFTVMVLIKLYLIGFSFLFYCHNTERKDSLAMALGAIAYTFSGAILFTFARHPNFINWAYFFPFLIGSIELYFRKGKKWPLILVVFLNLITSYYTFYYSAVLGSIYVIVHAACNVMKDISLASIVTEVKRVTNLAGVCCIGVLLSAFVLFPAIHAYLNSDRILAVTGYTASAWHYPAIYYTKLLDYIFAAFRTPGYYCFVGLNAVMIIPVILIFTKKKEHTALKLLLIISFLMLCVPLAGRIMNGFSYVSNRWTFVIPFYVSVTFVAVFSDIKSMSKKEKTCVFWITLAYVLCCVLNPINTDLLKYAALFIVMVVVAAVLGILNHKLDRYRSFMVFIVLFGACFQIYFTFAKGLGKYLNEFYSKSRVDASCMDWSNTAAPKADKGFYRVEMEETRTNTTGYGGVRGTGFLWGLVPAYVMDYYINLDLNSVIQNCHACSLDGRTGLLALASVKYYTKPLKEAGVVPYGYSELASKDKRYQVFENRYALPIGYTYSSYVLYDTYKELNGIEKEQALLQGTVLERELPGFDLTNPVFTYNTLKYKITGKKGVVLRNGSIKVTNPAATLTMETNIPKDSEIYVYVKGIKLEKDKSLMVVKVTRENTDYSITKSTEISNLNYTWPVLRNNVAFNLGHGHAGKNKITFTFKSKGTLSYDDIQIIAVPMTSYVTQIKKLKEHVLENVNVGNDKVTGTISLPEERILQFSIPYSDGWKALVDDKETVLLKSNVMYMALPLKAGNHTIELTYRTPYLREGFMVTGITGFLWALYEFLRKRRHSSGIMGDNS